MKAQIQKWGNSLALRIPKVFAEEANLEQNSIVEISLVDGKLMVVPVVPSQWTLDELLSGVTKDNIHRAIDTGFATGKEAW